MSRLSRVKVLENKNGDGYVTVTLYVTGGDYCTKSVNGVTTHLTKEEYEEETKNKKIIVMK